MRARPLRLLPLLALALVLPHRAAAQDAVHTLALGDTVRVLAPAWGSRMIQGELVVYHTDSLAVREAGTGTRYAVALAGVERLMKNEGVNRRRSVRRWGVAGLFLGFATGVVAGPLVSMERKDEDFVGATLVTSLGGGVLGLGLGAAGGAVFARDYWQPFRTPIVAPTYSSSAPAPSTGMALGVSIPTR